jgi:hypothetical protein
LEHLHALLLFEDHQFSHGLRVDNRYTNARTNVYVSNSGYTHPPTFGMLTRMSVKIAILKTNGLQGSYQQLTPSLAREVVNKLNPRELFTRGSLTLGTGNPYTLLNPNHISCIDVETVLPLKSVQPPGVNTADHVADKTAFMVELEKRWGQWRKLEDGGPGTPYEALLHFELLGGWERYVHVTGVIPEQEVERKVVTTLLDLPVLCIKRAGTGYSYINPANVVRARIYHSNREPYRPFRVLPLDPQEI